MQTKWWLIFSHAGPGIVTWWVKPTSSSVQYLQCPHYNSVIILVPMGYGLLTKGNIKFIKIIPTRCFNLSDLFLKWNSACFGQFLCPSSGVFYCTHSNGISHTGLLTAAHSCQYTCMTYTIAVCTVKNSWWWTEELSETRRVSFQE